MAENIGSVKRDLKKLVNRSYPDLLTAVEEVLGDYSDVMIFNRSRNTSVTVKLNDKILTKEEQSEPRSYSSTWNRYISVFVVDEDRNPLLRSVENEAICTKLLKEGCYVHDYDVIYSGKKQKMQVAFALVNADMQHIIFGFRNITEE